MSIIQSVLASYPPAASGPPTLPAWVANSTWYGLWNFNPAANIPPAALIDTGAGQLLDTGVAPYPIDIATFLAGGPDPPPYLTDTWYDQNLANNLGQGTAGKDPVFQITTPVIVTGGSQDGVYTYRGIVDSSGDGFFPYYNLLGQATDSTKYSVVEQGNGRWELTDASGTSIYNSGANLDSFPWLVVWTGITVAAGTQSGQIDFGTDGAGNAVTTGLQTANPLCNSGVGTIYILFKAGSLSATEVLFETGTGAAGSAKAKNISISLVAGVLTATIYDNTAVTPLANTKIKTISDTNWHLLALTWDVSLSAANQVSLKVDNSTTGVTAPISSTLAGLTIGNAVLNLGSRNNATSAPFDGSMQIVGYRPQADTPTQQTSMYNYIKYLNPSVT